MGNLAKVLALVATIGPLLPVLPDLIALAVKVNNELPKFNKGTPAEQADIADDWLEMLLALFNKLSKEQRSALVLAIFSFGKDDA